MKAINTSEKYGDRQLVTIQDYRELNPSGTFRNGASGSIYEIVDGKIVVVADMAYDLSELLSDKDTGLIANRLQWDFDSSDWEEYEGYAELFEALSRLAKNEPDAAVLREYAKEIRDDFAEEFSEE
jgi:hypothetical protein